MKKPTETPYLSLGMTGGSYQLLRPEFDVSGPANKGKTIYYRLNGVYENTQSFRDFGKSEKYFIAPYFLWKPTSSTTLAVLPEVINVERVSDYGAALHEWMQNTLTKVSRKCFRAVPLMVNAVFTGRFTPERAARPTANPPRNSNGW